MTSDGSRFVGQGEKNGANEAILWDENGGLRTMYEELVARGLELPSDVSALPGSPVYISSDGRTIVGASFNATSFWIARFDD
jgi:hypothetical protein